MKSVLTTVVICLSFFVTIAQSSHDQHIEEILTWQEEMDAEFRDPKKSPLAKPDRKKFKGLPYFEISSKFRVDAKFIRTVGERPFRMPTTTGRMPFYEKFGEAHFEIEGETFVLTIYQSHELRVTEEYKDYLFLPFTDLTNGEGTYEGGRYLGLSIPEGETIVIDFNKAYNPYCAYNEFYSCPIVPSENHLETRIEAGVKL